MKSLYYKAFRGRMRNNACSAFFRLSYTFTHENGSFLAKFSRLQNFKVAIYKGLVILRRQKYPKNGLVNCLFFEN